MQNWPASLPKALFLALMLSCLPAQAQSFVDLYREGLSAAERGDWLTVIDRMSRAAAADGNDQASRVLHGRFPRPYVPHHYLALAYAETNQCAKAREAAGKPGLQQALSVTALAQERQRQTSVLAKCQSPPPTPALAPILPPNVATTAPNPTPAEPRIASQPRDPTPPPAPAPAPSPVAPTVPAPAAFDAAAALAALRRSTGSVQRSLQPARSNSSLSDAKRRELARIEGELRAVTATALTNPEDLARRQSQLTRLSNESRALLTEVQAEQRAGQLAAAQGQLREQIRSAEALIASPELAGLGATLSVLREQVRQANTALTSTNATASTLQQRGEALNQALAGARRDLAARERDAQQREAQVASLQKVLDDIGKITAAQLRAGDRPLLQRAQSRLPTAQAALTGKDTNQLAAMLREMRAIKNELDKAAQARLDYIRAWAEFRPLLVAYSSGDAPKALGVEIKPGWPAELRAHARLLRAAVLWTTRAPISEVNREIDAARDAASALLRVPDKAFPPELLRRAQARGLQLQASPDRPS